MEKNRWIKVREIFSHISEQSPSFRKQYLDMVCEGELDLRTEVEKMLQANDEMDGHPAFSSDHSTDKLPDSIAGYRITGLLGHGGMSTVYAAEHPHFGEVALKVLPAHLVSHPVAYERFKQEAMLLQKINHAALCRLIEIKMHSKQAVIAMERASGSTLESQLQEGMQPLNVSLQITEAIADVLTETHRHGVVHRDLKPSNIMLDTHKRTRLIDFGIAKFADTNLTATGEIMGSPAYMSPEQWRGDTIGPETDVWSLGVVLYELLTGYTPFNADSVRDTAQLILGEAAVDVSCLVTGNPLHEGMRPLLQQMLDKNKQSRLASMDEVAVRLHQIRKDTGL